MVCRKCGTEIAAKAIICYKCGTATAEPSARRTSNTSSSASKPLIPVWLWAALAAAAAAAAWWRFH